MILLMIRRYEEGWHASDFPDETMPEENSDSAPPTGIWWRMLQLLLAALIIGIILHRAGS